MTQMKTKKTTALTFLQLVTGCALTACAFGMIILPLGLAASGVTGVSSVLAGIIPIPLSLMVLAINSALLLVGLLLWFFVNRASSRANEQIELLQALLDQQKRQNALLRRLCEANAPEKEDVAEPTVAGKAKGEDEFIRLVAER